MLKYWSIKKYGNKLLPTLEKNFGKKDFYSASEVRSTIYKNDFNPKYLPLGYILFLNREDLNAIFEDEFPHLSINEYKKEILDYLNSKSYQGYLQVLHQY